MALAHQTPLLKRGGSRGGAVKTLQRRLLRHGHAVTVDGVFGAGTEAAVKAFQAAGGLPVTGQTDPATWAALYAMPATKAAQAPATAWERVWAGAAKTWREYATAAQEQYAAFVKDKPDEARAKAEATIAELRTVEAALKRIAPLLPAPPYTKPADRARAEDYAKLQNRYEVLAARIYSDAQPEGQAAVGFVFVPVLVVLAGAGFKLALGMGAATFAVAAFNHAKNLREQTALYEHDLTARVEAAKGGYQLQPSTVPVPTQKPDTGGGAGLLIGGVVMVGLGGVGLWWINRRKAA